MNMTCGDVVIQEGGGFTASMIEFVQDPPTWGMGPDEQPAPRAIQHDMEGVLQIEIVYRGWMVLENGKRISVDELFDIKEKNNDDVS